LVNAWGFYKNKLGDSLVIDSSKFRKYLPYVGFEKIRLITDSLVLPKGMSLDFNSIAQGYTVDVIAQFLESKGDSNYLVEVGGELLAKGRNADGNIWKVGVDKPTDSIDSNERFLFVLDLENKALATSGNYRKFYEKDGVKYAHTINPFTAFPAQNRLLSVTVIHDNCMLADAYATAFMVMGISKSKQFAKLHPEIEVYLVYTSKDGSWKSFISPTMQKRIIN
jgi:thiamine biosynthesis lipoprotein